MRIESQPRSSRRPARFEGLGLASTLALALMLLSFLRTVGDLFSMKFGDVVMRTALETPLWGTSLGGSFIFFAEVQILVHLAFGTTCWVLAVASGKAWPFVKVTRRQWVLIWFIACSAWVIAANATLFPRSSLGEPYAHFAAARLFGLHLHVLFGAAILACIVFCLIRCLRALLAENRFFGRLGLVGIGSVAALLATTSLLASFGTRASNVMSTSKPHVILIGIDSLRSDLATGPEGSQLMPHLNQFLAHSVRFSDSMTPLARTFPSWVSILTGKQPHTTGAVINLLPRDMVKTGVTLPQALRGEGYRTFYAIDESRFSNIDESYGFDRIAAPPFGAADFLIGSINDTPLTNLLVNTRLGEWLTPNSYANRGVAQLYDPDTFIKRVGRLLKFDRPAFVAVHLTLMHWPFSWADSPRIRATKDPARLQEKYFNAARRVDQQFGDLIDLLRKRGALSNALVFVLSDHGEALGEQSETIYPYTLLGEQRDDLQINGHGTSVFSSSQYRVLVAMRSFGGDLAESLCGSVVVAPVSLVDIYPSIADALGIHVPETFDGRSLLPLLRRSKANGCEIFKGRIRFTETEFNPPGVSPGGAISASALEMASRYYDVVPSTGRMQIRAALVPSLLRQRQYAAIEGSTMVAAVPDSRTLGFRYMVARGNGNSIREFDPARGFADLSTVEQQLYAHLVNRFPVIQTSASQQEANH